MSLSEEGPPEKLTLTFAVNPTTHPAPEADTSREPRSGRDDDPARRRLANYLKNYELVRKELRTGTNYDA